MSDPAALTRAASALIDGVRGQALTVPELGRCAVELATLVQQLAEQAKSDEYRARAQVLSRMMQDRRGQIFTTTLTDRAHRSSSGKTTISQAAHLLTKLGAPQYLSPLDRLQLGMLKVMGGLAPALARSKMLERIREQTAAYILPGEADALARYLRQRKAEHLQVNVNHLGEEVLGELEAERRVQKYIALIDRPDVEAISVKISSIASQLDPLSYEASLETLRSRLRKIYLAAAAAQQSGQSKLVTLDMEAYRDVALTLQLFKELLDEAKLLPLTAGCVLQAYLPDSYLLQRELLQWAKQRRARGGAPVRMRLVKGANLAVERLESNHHGWELPVYASKREVDANFKRMLLLGTQPENAQAMRLGIGSHNLFDVCFGILARSSLGSERQVSFELLEGMADPLRSALQGLGIEVLLYAPVVERAEFPSAIAYLVRRLDENTAPENYLPHSFQMQVGDSNWSTQRQHFLDSCKLVEQVSASPRRSQPASPSAFDPELSKKRLAAPFANEPDTDFIQSQSRQALAQALAALSTDGSQQVRSNEQNPQHSQALIDGFDPSLPGCVPYRIELLDDAGLAEAIERGHRAASAFASTSVEERALLLLACADQLRRHRMELLALMVSDGGKRADEADAEVSEAIDFAEYYARSAIECHSHDDVTLTPRGLTVITPPWNFPLAIPVGGALGALVMGNPVILKPALETPRVMRRAVELFWQAGIPGDVLQLAVCEDQVASRLIRDPRVQAVVLTGATATAQKFLSMRPGLALFAETGGKNGLIVMPMADRELAVQDIVASAFGHAGQKCSALSQLVLHRELYDDDAFLALLKDAAASLQVGAAWDPSHRLTPLIQEPNDLQKRALTTLEKGESWLLQPRSDANNPKLWSPGIKLGVEPGSFSHQTEFFCPVLSVLRALDLDDAIAIVNGTRYGLTSGIHTLDEREQEVWASRVQAGNLYINRKITGAVVRRQAFGGWKASSFGAGAKAGGPNYVAQFVHLRDRGAAREVVSTLPRALEQQLQELQTALLKSCPEPLAKGWIRRARALSQRLHHDYERWFRHPKDESQLIGQDNHHRYVPVRLLVWCDFNVPASGDPTPRDDKSDPPALDAMADTLLTTLLGSWVTGASVGLAMSPSGQHPALAGALKDLIPNFSVASDDELAQLFTKERPDRLRVIGQLTERPMTAASQLGIFVDDREAVSNGRFELLRYLREQSLSVTYHRYGHLGLRELDDGSGNSSSVAA